MTRKSQLTYEAVFKHLKQLVPGWQPEVIMTDFELPCRNAARTVWPTATLVGCFFHYAQALFKIIGLYLTLM